ncbi:MAG: hypothetical protein EPO61_00440 [Nitrospirae bacterium]|nr:MAG: hypothetical protein EPO61_00440 [Nitrospirota bacterium]
MRSVRLHHNSPAHMRSPMTSPCKSPYGLTRGWSLAAALTPVLFFSPAWAEEPAQSTGKGIGAITSVQGKVMMDHLDPAAPFPATTKESLQQNDVIQTHAQGRTKVLLEGGNLLTLGENSRVEILDHRHDSAQAQAATTVRLTQGSLRAMVGSAHTAGATFEVQTPTSRVVAHGGTLVVWADGTLSGAANIGTAGMVDFIAGGQISRLEAGQYSHTDGGAPPGPPALIAAGTHARMQDAIGATHVKESLKHEAPKDALRDIGAPRALGLGLGGAQVGPGQDLTASKDGSAGVDQAQGGGDSGNNAKSSTTAGQPRHNTVPHARAQTPPGVHSGASNRLLRPDEHGPIRGEGRIRQ